MSKANSTSPDDLLSTRDAGAELGIGTRRTQTLIEEGRLPAMRIGKFWAIRRGDLDLVRDRPPGRPRTKPGDKPPQAKKKKDGRSPD